MQPGEVRSRFGRCPYCRAMIYQDLTAIIFYCSKCRTPIRGKSPQPTDETEYALAQLEILSADTASVFSDDVEPSNPRAPWAVGDDDGEPEPEPPVASRSTATRSFLPSSRGRQGTGAASSYREFGSVRAGPRSSAPGSGLSRDSPNEAAGSGSPLHSRVTELRPSSRRTRRSSSGDVDARSDGGSGTESDSDVPAPASSSYTRRASPLSSQELEMASVLSGLETVDIERSRLSDPAFQKDLLQALDNLRRLIAAVDHPRSIKGQWKGMMMPRLSASCNDDGGGGGGKRTITRRSSRLMRRLESQLTQALPAERPRREPSTSSSSSSASSSRRGGLRAPRAHHCRPVLGGTPFVVCVECSEVLLLPAGLPVGRAARIQCGGCREEFDLTLPAIGSTDLPKKIFSAPQTVGSGGQDAEEYPFARRSNWSGEQPRPPGPLHRVLGYSSVSSVLRSRRYDEQR